LYFFSITAVEIQYEGLQFSARFIENDKPSNEAQRDLNTPDDLASRKLGPAPEPPIQIWCKPQQGLATVEQLSTIISRIAKEYMELMDTQKKTVRSRYEYSASGKWTRVCNLPDIRGLETVALPREHETLLERSLDSFENSKDFYARIGSPWRKGILLYGCPGTGKTSLVFAIA
jgi:DNA replication protein DnaC